MSYLIFCLDISVLVGTAFRAGHMGKFGLLAFRTFCYGRGLGFVMGPSFSAPCLGAFLFWYCHWSLLKYAYIHIVFSILPYDNKTNLITVISGRCQDLNKIPVRRQRWDMLLPAGWFCDT